MNMDITSKRPRDELTENTSGEPLAKKTDLGLDPAAPQESNMETETENPDDEPITLSTIDDGVSPIVNSTTFGQDSNTLVDTIEQTNKTFILNNSFATASELLNKMVKISIDDTPSQMETETNIEQDSRVNSQHSTADIAKLWESSADPNVQKIIDATNTMCNEKLNTCLKELHEDLRKDSPYNKLIASYKDINKIKKTDSNKLPSKEDIIKKEVDHKIYETNVFEILYKCVIPPDINANAQPNKELYNNLQLFLSCLSRKALAMSTKKPDLKWLGFLKETSFFESFRVFVEEKRTMANPDPKQPAIAPMEQQDTQVYHDVTMNDSPTVVEVPAGDAFIKNGLELNEMLFRNFNSRVLYNSSNQLQLNVLRILEDHSTEPIKTQLLRAFDNLKNDTLKKNEIYLVPKLLLDGGDVAHDAVRASISSSYIDALNNIGNSYSTQFDPKKLNACFAEPKQDEQFKTVSQERLRTMRTSEIVKLRQYIMNLNILLPNMGNRTLTQEEGYFELIKHIITINIGQFVYKESGRELLIQTIRDYFTKLDTEKQDQFVVDCIDYCDVEDSTIVDRIKELITGKNPARSLQVELFPITSFDGCGTTNIMTPSNDIPAIFDYVFGKYTYTVYTIRPSGAKSQSNGPYSYTFWHLVIVTNTEGDDVPVAIFGFAGNITINMLLSNLKIPTSRSGEGGKGMLMSIKTLITELNKPGMVYTLSPNEAIQISDTDSTYYTTQTIPDRQLLLLGNKTIGDLIFTTYNKSDNVYAVSTVDSLIANSAMYNFLCGNTAILPSVWMQSGGKGWKFTPGLFVEDNKQKATIMTVQILSSFMLISVLANSAPAYNDILVAYTTAIKRVYIEFNSTNVEPLYRFYKIINYILDGFNTIQNYTGSDNVYNSCITQLLIYENYIIKQRIAAYVNQLTKCIQQYLSDFSTTYKFLNNVYTLPKLDTLLVSNMSSVASNNQSAVNLSELIEFFYVAPKSSVKNIIITKINSTHIYFTLRNTTPGRDDKNFENNHKLLSKNDVVINRPTQTGSRPNIIYSVNCEMPYTIQTLIQMLLSSESIEFPAPTKVTPIATTVDENPEGEGEADDDEGLPKLAITKDDIKRLITTFFKTNISTLSSFDTDVSNNISTIVTQNINQILFKEGILRENELSSPSVDLVIDPECQECSNGVCPLPEEQPVSGEQPTQIEPMIETGGKLKTTRKKRKTKQKRKTKGGNKKVLNKTKKQRKNKKNAKTRKRK